MPVNRNLAAVLAATAVLAGCGEDKQDGNVPVATPTVAKVTSEIPVTIGPGAPTTSVKSVKNGTGVEVSYKFTRTKATRVKLINNGLTLSDVTLKPGHPIRVILQQVQPGLLSVVAGKRQTDIKVT